MFLKSLLLSTILMTSAFGENTAAITINDHSNMTISENEIAHIKHQKTLTFKAPVGNHGIKRFEVSVLPKVVGGDNVLSLSLQTDCAHLSNKKTVMDFVEKLYQSFSKGTVVMSSMTEDMVDGKTPWPESVGLEIRNAITLDTFEKNLPLLLTSIKENFELDEANLQEIETFLTSHATIRQAQNKNM